MADPAGSAPASSGSGNPLWDNWFDQDEKLRVLAQRIWQVSQELEVTTGYTGVAQMLEIDDKLPLSIKVRSQERRLKALQDLDTFLASKALASAGHNQDILDGRGGGSQQRDLNAASKRTAEGPLVSAATLKRPRKPPRNKDGNKDVQALITAARNAAARPDLVQRPIPPNMLRVQYGYKTAFVHYSVATQHEAFWDADEPQIFMPAQLTMIFSAYIRRNESDRQFLKFVKRGTFPHENAINCAKPPITYIWSCAGCHIPFGVNYLESIVGAFWRHGYLELLKFLGEWLRDARRRPTVTTGIMDAAVQEIRRGLPLWPNLGPDDCT